MRAFCDPLFVFLELEAELVIKNPKVTVGSAYDSFRHDGRHFLRHDADIGRGAADVGEAVETKSVVQPSDQGDVVLEVDVRSTPAAATTAAATAAESAATAAAAETA